VPQRNGRVTDSRKPVRIPGKERLARPLPRRFYNEVRCELRGEKFEVHLDGRSVKTPKKIGLMLPTRALGDAIAEEWARQGERINPATMPLTKLVNSAIDGVTGREAEARTDILKYAANDLLCYRAEGPHGLVKRQARAWDPVVDWAHKALGARFIVAAGVMPVVQSAQALTVIAAQLEGLDAFRLASLHVMTTLMGSALLALAHAHGRLTAAEAWAAAHVDEDWQIEQWGADAEAAARRQRRWEEMWAASQFLRLIDTPSPSTLET
jgi:chaperone required for assembly of F1-ATPase